MKEELQKLIEQYGADAVAKAATEALNKHVPTINTPVVTDEQLINTISQLDAAVTDILETGRKNEETYQNKVELVRRARQLETSIQITEAEAINTICGTGKDAYGIIPYSDGTHVRVAVTNDTQRDAFRRHFSADERKELASVEADIKAIEVSQFKAREDLDAKKEALSCIRAKAQLQAAPHIVNLSLPGLRSQGIINCLQTKQIYVSAGSACSKGHRSHVLEAMHLPPAVIDGSVRISFCGDNTREDVDRLIDALLEAKTTLKG